MKRIFTIGHSNRQWNEFTCLLQDNHVGMVADVRRYPNSKSFPQFNKEIMSKELESKTIGYKHIEKLGGRRKEIVKALTYDNSAWHNKSFRSYADYMMTLSFKEGIKELLSLIAKCEDDDAFLSIMCSEALPWRCHRRLIADYLVMIEDISVYDIIGNSKSANPHKITPFAVHLTDDDDDKIIYPKS